MSHLNSLFDVRLRINLDQPVTDGWVVVHPGYRL